MADVGEAWQNGYAERLIRAIKEEEVDLSEYIDYHDAYQQIGLFLDDVYMHKRIHSSLGYLTPAQFEEQWRYEYTLSLESELEIAGKVSNFRGSLQSMQVHFIRNATLIIRAGPQHILVDPITTTLLSSFYSRCALQITKSGAWRARDASKRATRAEFAKHNEEVTL